MHGRPLMTSPICGPPPSLVVHREWLQKVTQSADELSMYVRNHEGRGPRYPTALVSAFLATATVIALGAPEANAAPKPTGAMTGATAATGPVSGAVESLSSITNKAGRNGRKAREASAGATRVGASLPGTVATTAAKVTTKSRKGGGNRVKTGTTVSVIRPPTHCGRSPLGPISNGQTIVATGTVILSTPVILDHCSGVTFNGGTWIDPNTSPGKAYGGGLGNGRPAFDIISGSNITMENLRINGANKGGAYREDLAFNSGIWTQGTAGLTLSNVRVAHVFGDCLTLAPLRSGKGRDGIVAPVRDLKVDGFRGNACGRQGIALSSVNGAVLTNITIGATAFDAFDAEADQPGREGAMNVTVDHCSFSGLIAIKAGGGFTGPITFSNCTMSGAVGSVLSVYNSSGRADAGPISFVNDSLRCGASVYVSCFQLNGATDTRVENSRVTIGYRRDLVHESAYSISGGTHITFADDVVKGFGKMGHSFGSSTATVSGGTWSGQSCHRPAVCPAR